MKLAAIINHSTLEGVINLGRQDGHIMNGFKKPRVINLFPIQLG